MLADLKRILAIQALRALAYGFGAVVLGSSLAAGGLAAWQVGLVFTAMLVGMAGVSVLVGRYAERWGRRRSYLALLGVMGVAGAVFALAGSVLVLVLAALTGTMSTDPNESGPITSLEQAMMGSAPASQRAAVFGRYNATAYLAGAVGALAAGGPVLLRQVVPALPSDRRYLLVFPLLALVAIAVGRRLSPEVEAPGSGAPGSGAPGVRAPRRTAGLGPSRRTVRQLATLFAVDSLAGGFVVQTFLVYWFTRRYGADAAVMGLVFFGVGLLAAASSIAAGWLGGRIGLLRTMVFTHLPSNVMLALIPLAGSLPGAVVLLLARSALSQMDVPARQAYVVSMVTPSERTAAAAYTNTARYVTRPVGPLGAGLLVAQVGLVAPFLVAGILKSGYDLVLYAMFRRVPLPEEPAGSERAARP
ncbi:MAG: MFS transporter [Actinomycetes bacterium]